ncbi:MAG TPA: hypothetical protein VJX67_06525, partial [Blastocatellia bacterium]|nr:hypothetical protein [Blastocatellia bacterium]
LFSRGAIPLCVLFGSVAYLYSRRRGEYRADRATVKMTGQAEVVIASILSLTKLGVLPPDSVSWPRRRLWVPSTADRIKQIAREAGISDERNERLVAERQVGPQDRIAGLPVSNTALLESGRRSGPGYAKDVETLPAKPHGVTDTSRRAHAIPKPGPAAPPPGFSKLYIMDIAACVVPSGFVVMVALILLSDIWIRKVLPAVPLFARLLIPVLSTALIAGVIRVKSIRRRLIAETEAPLAVLNVALDQLPGIGLDDITALTEDLIRLGFNEIGDYSARSVNPRNPSNPSGRAKRTVRFARLLENSELGCYAAIEQRLGPEDSTGSVPVACSIVTLTGPKGILWTFNRRINPIEFVIRKAGDQFDYLPGAPADELLSSHLAIREKNHFRADAPGQPAFGLSSYLAANRARAAAIKRRVQSGKAIKLLLAMDGYNVRCLAIEARRKRGR